MPILRPKRQPAVVMALELDAGDREDAIGIDRQDASDVTIPEDHVVDRGEAVLDHQAMSSVLVRVLRSGRSIEKARQHNRANCMEESSHRRNLVREYPCDVIGQRCCCEGDRQVTGKNRANHHLRHR